MESISFDKVLCFDDLFVGHPVEIEKNFRTLLPRAKVLENNSIYLRILSQIALAQAMQKDFDLAHETLDTAERLLTSEDYLAHARILIERGRVFWQSGDIVRAIPFIQQGFELSKTHKFDYHTINAAHLMAILVETSEEKIHWNEISIELAESSNSPRGRAWLGPLYNNIGGAYIEAGGYEKALNAYEKCLAFWTEERNAIHSRVAKWGIARALRFLDRLNEALEVLSPLIEDYQSIIEREELDLPIELLEGARGVVYEELAEVYSAKARKLFKAVCQDQIKELLGKSRDFARLAYEDLSKNEWFQKMESMRLQRLKQIQEMGVDDVFSQKP